MRYAVPSLRDTFFASVGGKELNTRALYRLIEDGGSYRVQRYQDEWEVNFDSRMCIANLLKNWERAA